MASVGLEVARAVALDLWAATRTKPDPILRLEAGLDPQPDSRSVALYVHYSPGDHVSGMVHEQLATYRAAGFAVVFISMASHLQEADWQAVREVCALVVHRRNGGLDFGAWPAARHFRHQIFPGAEEVLLANDSVLGPIRPIGPIIAIIREGGPGVFGLTESHQGGRHLQSYFLLARGRIAVETLQNFLAQLRISVSKWMLIQRAEIGLTRYLHRHGVPVSAVFGYERLIDAVLAAPEELADLLRGSLHLSALADLPKAELRQLLLQWPVNPTHTMWRGLVRRMGFPFIKTELVRRNPGRLRDVELWPELVQDVRTRERLLDHLKSMGSAIPVAAA